MFERAPAMMRRHHAHHDLRAGESLLKVVGCASSGGQRAIGKEQAVGARLRYSLANFFLQRPEPYLVIAAPAGDNGYRRAPGTGADHGNPAQARFSLAEACEDFPPPKRFSLPWSSRRMF